MHCTYFLLICGWLHYFIVVFWWLEVCVWFGVRIQLHLFFSNMLFQHHLLDSPSLPVICSAPFTMYNISMHTFPCDNSMRNCSCIFYSVLLVCLPISHANTHFTNYYNFTVKVWLFDMASLSILSFFFRVVLLFLAFTPIHSLGLFKIIPFTLQ